MTTMMMMLLSMTHNTSSKESLRPLRNRAWSRNCFQQEATVSNSLIYLMPSNSQYARLPLKNQFIMLAANSIECRLEWTGQMKVTCPASTITWAQSKAPKEVKTTMRRLTRTKTLRCRP